MPRILYGREAQRAIHGEQPEHVLEIQSISFFLHSSSANTSKNRETRDAAAMYSTSSLGITYSAPHLSHPQIS